ncbi:N-alpha-acetyltransferase 50 [Rhizoclosmatium sp. JEL0117]|nr:N-alpha-acetyltransferase 50 [Rhizoclosmatium sp. JEL0117]
MTVIRPAKFFRSSTGDLTPNNIGQLKVILERTMPAGFTADLDAFCKEALSYEELTQLVYFNDMPVGAIVCFKEVDAKDQPTSKSQKNAVPPHTLVIKALGILEPYRNLDLSTLLLETIINLATDKTKAITCVDIGNSEDAIKEVFETAGFAEKDGKWVKTIN